MPSLCVRLTAPRAGRVVVGLWWAVDVSGTPSPLSVLGIRVTAPAQIFSCNFPSTGINVYPLGFPPCPPQRTGAARDTPLPMRSARVHLRLPFCCGRAAKSGARELAVGLAMPFRWHEIKCGRPLRLSGPCLSKDEPEPMRGPPIAERNAPLTRCQLPLRAHDARRSAGKCMIVRRVMANARLAAYLFST